MTKEEFKQLEQLLYKFAQSHHGSICLCYPIIQDAWNVGLYNPKTGDVDKQFTGPTLESVYKQMQP